MATVNIRILLGSLTTGAQEVSIQGNTVTYECTRERIITPADGRRNFVNLFLANRGTRHLNDLQTPVPDPDVLAIVPAVDRGCP
jgi:molybdopterin converting factor small subunit